MIAFPRSFLYCFQINLPWSHVDNIDTMVRLHEHVVMVETDDGSEMLDGDFCRLSLTDYGERCAAHKVGDDSVIDLFICVLRAIQAGYEVVCRKENWDNRDSKAIQIFWRPPR